MSDPSITTIIKIAAGTAIAILIIFGTYSAFKNNFWDFFKNFGGGEFILNLLK